MTTYGQDRLVMPPVAGVTDVRPPDDDQDDDEKRPPKPKRRNGGDDGAGRHQLIDGLILTLPPEGSEWSTEDRRRWLQAAAAIFDLIYKNAGGNTALTIEVKNSAK